MIYHISDEIIGLNVEWSIIPKIKWVYSLTEILQKGNTYIENVFSNFMGTFDYFRGKARCYFIEGFPRFIGES